MLPSCPAFPESVNRFISQHSFTKAIERAAFLPFGAIRFHVLTPFPGAGFMFTFRKSSTDAGERMPIKREPNLKKQKCACPQSVDGRKGIISSN